MSGIWKHNIGLSIFGESHGESVGITISGLEPGLALDEVFVQSELDRRKPGQSDLTTPRKESDKFEIISGLFEGHTTGAPLTMIIRNTNKKSSDYDHLKDRLRPGHADYTAKEKYKGFTDYRGSGHFSGRITAGLVFAGAVAKSILSKKDIVIGSQILSIHDVYDDLLPSVINESHIKDLQQAFPVINKDKADKMKAKILEAKEDKNSVGGKIRCFAVNMPTGLGDPFFESFESILSGLIFSVPATKALEFGAGVSFASMYGSQSNDDFYYEEGIKTRTNNNGGINGGITNGMPVDITVTIKPTPSIGKNQESVDMKTNQPVNLSVEGRHDPCIVPRVLPVIESVLAITILDLMS